MTLERKSGEETSSTRDAILDATEIIMIEEGYAAVTSRRVAEKAGLKSQLVHYHFGSMDDLFVAVYERSQREFVRRHLQAVTSANPLRALWDLSIHPKRARLSQELIALSNHRKSIQKITARLLMQMHDINVDFISKYLEDAGVDLDVYSPLMISYIINGVSRGLVTEEAAGVTERHAQIAALAERWLSSLEAKHRARAAERQSTMRSGGSA
jgi:AcrR family transcriptional regulator